MKKKIKHIPRKIFEKILKYAVVPTFDMVIEYGNQGIVIGKRKIAPYKDQWALPGQRIFKGEKIDDALKRIAKKDFNLNIDPKNKVFLGQYMGKFKTEQDRQDLSTGFYIKVSDKQKIIINPERFSSYKIANEIPFNMGAMYKFYIKKYFKLKK